MIRKPWIFTHAGQVFPPLFIALAVIDTDDSNFERALVGWIFLLYIYLLPDDNGGH